MTILKEGKGVMPAFAFLSEAESEALVAHVYGEPEPESTRDHAAAAGRPYSHMGYNRFLDPDGYPAVKPPWGTLNAIDLDAGEIRWTVPLGRASGAHREGDPPHRHRELRGADRHRRGPGLHRGHEGREVPGLRQAHREGAVGDRPCPPAGYATPATYEANGKQYVVIAAGGGKMGTKSGDTYLAFALPD